ncbi:MAG: hypothetical protein GEU99_11675 [Luteitalea sp.]|nr:hypothetical protein [Luteitalea sp.]
MLSKSLTVKLLVGTAALCGACGYESSEPTAPEPAPRPSTAVTAVDDVARELDWGNITFNAPSAMRYQQPETVELLLSPSLPIAQLQSQLEQQAGAESAKVKISNRMEATLTGTGFAIQAQAPDLQAISSEGTSRWRWEVTPTSHGSQRLSLVLSAHIDVAGRDAPLVIETFNRRIEVDITVRQRVSSFVQNNWQWLWTALLVPIAGYLGTRWKRRRAQPKH